MERTIASSTAGHVAPAALALARRFAAGATMWCVAPQWSAHARHVAVEFVHPVVVGTRAFPSVSLDGATATETLRLLARPGDVVLVAAPADDAVARDLVRRAGAWGLTSIWVGAGPRPSALGTARADHVVWLEGADPDRAAHSGELVLVYHLLWELTHVAFEHPGLVAADTTAGAEEICITCSDEGRVAEVRAVLDEGRVEVLAGGRTEQIDGRLVEDLRPGDLVLVHAGVALTQLAGSRG